MLPQLTTNKRDAMKNSHNKLPGAQKNRPFQNQPEKHIGMGTKIGKANVKSMSSQKVRTGGGFNKKTPQQQYESAFDKNVSAMYSSDKYAKMIKIKNSGNNLAAEIKMIQKKIKACQRKIQQDKKRQKMLAQQNTRDRDQPQYDFQKVVKREMQLQGYYQSDQGDNYGNNFDYLTNPGGKPQPIQQEPQQIPEPPLIVPPKTYNIEQGLQKMQRHYQNNLKRKFQRREMFPHQACRRKTPKLYISHKTNTVNKYGKASNDAQHMFRVYTKQTTPQQIYPTIPNFAVVKDGLSKNIVAYLGDYKPFIEKTKNAQMNESEGLNQTQMGESKNWKQGKQSKSGSRQMRNLRQSNEKYENLGIGSEYNRDNK